MQGLVRNFISVEEADKYVALLDAKHAAGLFMLNDGQVNTAPSFYGNNWQLLENSLEKMEDITGLTLGPTYDYARIYSHGEELRPHRDRPACQYSVTVCLKNEKEPWDFWYEHNGKDVSVAMQAGDAVVYRGCETRHWRLPNPTGRVWQAFLHYVDLNGPHADNADEYLTYHHDQA